MHGEDALVFVFRGADSIHDMLVNLDISSVPDSVLRGDAHEGFLQTYKSIEATVRTALEGVGERRILLHLLPATRLLKNENDGGVPAAVS